jgi:hypothetical protein
MPDELKPKVTMNFPEPSEDDLVAAGRKLFGREPTPAEIEECKAIRTRRWDPAERHTCRDCGVLEGGLHELGCEQEWCPFCLGLLFDCGCRYKHFYPTYDGRIVKDDAAPGGWRPAHPTLGLPQDVYERGLPQGQAAEWERVLKAKGRIRFILVPSMCRRCGQALPDMFMADDWHDVIPVNIAREVLCLSCYEVVRGFVLAARGDEKETSSGAL